mgnify:CR=1 FL=1
MLRTMIHAALSQRLLVLVLTCVLIGFGVRATTRLSVDAFPDVTNVQVMVLTEAPGLSAVDVEQQITYPIEQQMGAKREDMWKIKGWTDAFFQRISLMLPEDQHLEMVDREIEAQHYFQPIFERLRKQPDESLISVLVNTVIEEWGRPLTDNELHAEMMADTFVGGSETTTNALAAGMKLLIENKDVWHKLKSDPERYMKTFVEEVVRLESPVQSLMRFCAEDVELSGVTIPARA